ncbi:MAG: hypothetical protein Q9222_002560 [Ikaeria aurantiellina]
MARRYESSPLAQFSVQVYIYCPPCSCQIASALDTAWSMNESPYLDIHVRVDYHLQTSCSVSSIGINGLQSLADYIREDEKLINLPDYHVMRLRAIDRQWLEQTIYDYEEEIETLTLSPASRLSKILAAHNMEDDCAAVLILGEADYSIPLIGSPPFPPLKLGKVPQQTEMYRLKQAFEEGWYWQRDYMGTFTSKSPHVQSAYATG